GEGAEGAGPLGVHAPLGDHLTDEVGQLLLEPHVLREQRTARARGEAVLLVGHRSAELGGDVRGGALRVFVRRLAHGVDSDLPKESSETTTWPNETRSAPHRPAGRAAGIDPRKSIPEIERSPRRVPGLRLSD